MGIALHMDPTDGTSRPLGRGDATAHEVAYVYIGGAEFIVVALSTGAQIWSGDGLRMLYFFALTSVIGAAEGGIEPYCRGIGAIKGSKAAGGQVLVGCSDGDVFVINVPDISGARIEFGRSLRGHARSITALGSGDEHCASADAGGRIIVWSIGNSFAQQCSFSSDGFPVTSLAVRRGVLVSSLGTGCVRVHRIAGAELILQIGSHARAVNAMDLHPTQPIVASVGSDAQLNVWSFMDGEEEAKREGGRGDVNLLYNDSVPDAILTGVRFAKCEDMGMGKVTGLGIVALAYDTDLVFRWAPWGE